MLALTGPNSTTSLQILEMKRPSDVPPVVESSVSTPVSLRIACARASLSAPGVVRNGSPPSVQAISCSTPWRATIASSRERSDAGVDSVLKRKLKSTTSSPGMTLPAPVPAWMFDICHDVGGKCALPRSHSTPTSSASSGAARWIGFFASCG